LHVRVDHALRERLHEQVVGAMDASALKRGVHAEVDLGASGRIAISAEKHTQVTVQLQSDVGSTAQVLTRHANELTSELARGGHDARVTISGPSTSATFNSASNNGGERRESQQRDDSHANDPDVLVEQQRPAARSSRRVRMVL